MPTQSLPTESLGAGRAALLVFWFAVSFSPVFFARELQFTVLGWPLNYWLAAQGIVLIFVGTVAAYTWHANRSEAEDEQASLHGKASTYEADW